MGLLVLVGCVEAPSEIGREHYFDVAEFLEKQATRLTESGATVRKTVLLNGREERTVAGAVNWARELAPFEAADLNRPAWRDRYRIDTVRRGEERRVTYVARDEDLPVDRLELLLRGEHLHELRVDLRNRNVLYDSRRRLELFCDSTTHLVRSYGVRGYQKLILRDSVRFAVNARLVE